MKLLLFRATLLSAGALFLATTASVSRAAIIVPPGAIWEYTFSDPTGNPIWNTTTGAWTTGAAPFSSRPDGDFGANTPWPVDGSDLDDDLWLRVAVDLTGYDLNTIDYDLGVDNGFKLYANGNLIASDNAEGGTSRWEYSGTIESGSLLSGFNVFAVALEDHGEGTSFDMQVSGTPKAGGVPDGGSTAMMIALGGILAVAARRKLSVCT